MGITGKDNYGKVKVVGTKKWWGKNSSTRSSFVDPDDRLPVLSEVMFEVPEREECCGSIEKTKRGWVLIRVY